MRKHINTVLLIAVGLVWFAGVKNGAIGAHQAMIKEPEQVAPSLGAVGATPKETSPSPAAPAKAVEAVKKAPVRGPSHSPEAIGLERKVFTRYYNRLDTTRVAEPEDRIWANEIRYDVEQVMKLPAFVGSKIESIQCGSTLCRIEADHKDFPAKMRYTDEFMVRIGKVLPEATMYADPDSSKTVAYFARAGTELPRIPEAELEEMTSLSPSP